jgi:hypothetical protein
MARLLARWARGTGRGWLRRGFEELSWWKLDGHQYRGGAVSGLGTRLLPATKSQPKEMLPVGRKPVVQYVVEELTRMKMKRVLFITRARQDFDRKSF